jgi:hypothetical protein
MPRHSLDTYSPRNSATWELALEPRASPVAPRLRVDHAPVTPEFTVPRLTTPTRFRGLLVLVWYGVVKALYTT